MFLCSTSSKRQGHGNLLPTISYQTMHSYSHENILALMACSFSEDPHDPLCLVYQFMPNGTVHDRFGFLPCRVVFYRTQQRDQIRQKLSFQAKKLKVFEPFLRAWLAFGNISSPFWQTFTFPKQPNIGLIIEPSGHSDGRCYFRRIPKSTEGVNSF